MDELELLKKVWKKQESSFPKLRYEEIYSMIFQKSSSIVKWIFRISILEFMFWVAIDLILRYNNTYEGIQEERIQQYSIVTTVVSYSILIYFMLLFYRNYKKIKTIDSASTLMRNILKTRSTVRSYVFVNLTFLTLLMTFTFGYMVWYSNSFEDIPLSKRTLSFILGGIMVVVIGISGLLYYLVYGLLNRKLKQNYKALQELET